MFENYIVQEIVRANDYFDLNLKLFYWRTNTGKEVDIILASNYRTPKAAIEIKSKSDPDDDDLESLNLFLEEYPEAKALCFCLAPRIYEREKVTIIPWQEGIKTLKQLF